MLENPAILSVDVLGVLADGSHADSVFTEQNSAHVGSHEPRGVVDGGHPNGVAEEIEQLGQLRNSVILNSVCDVSS